MSFKRAKFKGDSRALYSVTVRHNRRWGESGLCRPPPPVYIKIWLLSRFQHHPETPNKSMTQSLGLLFATLCSPKAGSQGLLLEKGDLRLQPGLQKGYSLLGWVMWVSSSRRVGEGGCPNSWAVPWGNSFLACPAATFSHHLTLFSRTFDFSKSREHFFFFCFPFKPE